MGETPVDSQPLAPYGSVRYPVPWKMCHSKASHRVIGSRPHIHDADRRHVCVHETSPVKGSSRRLEGHRREPEGDWTDIAERMRPKWNCTDSRHLINGLKGESQARHLGRQLAAVERHLDEGKPSRALAAEAMEIRCRDFRYRHTQFRAVFDLVEARRAGGGAQIAAEAVPAADVDGRGMDSYGRAFEERRAS